MSKEVILAVSQSTFPLGYSFEDAHPDDLGKGVRLASSAARSELSAVTSSQLTIAPKKNPSSISKESMDSLDLDSRSYLPDKMRHLIERIIKRQYSQQEIIRTTASILTERRSKRSAITWKALSPVFSYLAKLAFTSKSC